MSIIACVRINHIILRFHQSRKLTQWNTPSSSKKKKRIPHPSNKYYYMYEDEPYYIVIPLQS